MKVLWVADFGIEHNPGGAQRTNDFVIKEGLSRNHHISFLHYDTNFNDIVNNDYDIVVSNNLEHLSRNPKVLSYLIQHKKHVRFEHDANRYLSIKNREMLFGSTVLNIFLSEYHLDMFRTLYGDIFHKTEIVSSPISNRFYDRKEKRENKVLYAGFLHYLKGINTFFQYVINNPSVSFVVAGWGHPQIEQAVRRFNNAEFLGKVEYEDMPELYNKYKTFYYMPNYFEPFCRAVGEAIVSGMDIKCSNNIGAVQDYKRLGREKFTDMCRNSPKKFWDLLEDI